MGGRPGPCLNSVAEEFGCMAWFYGPRCKDTLIEHEQHFLDDLDFFSTKADGELVDQEAGIAVNGVVHVVDDTPPLTPKSTLDVHMLKDLPVGALISCSEVVESHPLSYDGEREFLSATSQIESFLESHSPTSECSSSSSTTPPRTLRILVSAMKGGRAQLGTRPSEKKLSVKWAPEVYDPPVTSDSHTVKGHGHRHHRSKAKIGPCKHKLNSKTKPSRGSTGVERKHHVSRRSSVARS